MGLGPFWVHPQQDGDALQGEVPGDLTLGQSGLSGWDKWSSASLGTGLGAGKEALKAAFSFL